MSESPAKKKSETNIKDTIESILVAFILAFIFRCFVVEAFVIPTGSMAPTLMGAHMNFRCPDCGYAYTVGFNSNNPNDETFNIPTHNPQNVRANCPNCGYELPTEPRDDPDNSANKPPLKYGDRILVMKYLYLFNEPQRWDVVVFKSPYTSTQDYSVNYIKRLIGTPGESIAICNGDIYVAPKDAKANDKSRYVVQPKPQHVQDALWRIISDSDYVPLSSRGDQVTRLSNAWKQPWQPKSGSGWVNDDPSKGVSPRQFVFDNLNGAGTLALDPSVNQGAQFTDWLAYNQGADNGMRLPVGDLKIEFFVSDLTGSGALRAILRKDTDDLTGTHQFVAELSGDAVRLVKHSPQGTKVIGEKQMALTGTHHVVLQNVDYRVELRVDDEVIAATTPDDYRPDFPTLMSQQDRHPAGDAQLEGDRVKARIEHLRVWRDIYYRTDGRSRASAKNGSLEPLTLRNDEYFTLGDNSSLSQDGRFWDNGVYLPDEKLDVPAGVVPGRFLLGKAFFVYWPAGYKPASSLPVALIPNFGEMRFIR